MLLYMPCKPDAPGSSSLPSGGMLNARWGSDVSRTSYSRIPWQLAGGRGGRLLCSRYTRPVFGGQNPSFVLAWLVRVQNSNLHLEVTKGTKRSKPFKQTYQPRYLENAPHFLRWPTPGLPWCLCWFLFLPLQLPGVLLSFSCGSPGWHSKTAP